MFKKSKFAMTIAGLGIAAIGSAGLAAQPASAATSTVPRAVAVSGKPSASNTGVPAGTALTRYNGNLVITTPGAVIDRLDIHGFVTIKAANVTIKRSIIRGAASNVKTGLLKITDAAAGNGFLIEDVTLVPEFPSVYLDGIKVNKSGTFRRINMSGTVDGFTMYGAGITLQNSYLHDFVTYASDPSQGGGPSHSDTIQVQSGSNVRITANTLQGAKNAAVMITQDAGATKDLWINSNWIDNGGCSVNYSSSGAYKTGMQANNNRFGRAQRNPGCALVHNPLKSDLKPTGNVWDDNGAPVAITKGT